jgi:hypothetical protein
VRHPNGIDVSAGLDRQVDATEAECPEGGTECLTDGIWQCFEKRQSVGREAALAGTRITAACLAAVASHSRLVMMVASLAARRAVTFTKNVV